MIPHRNSVRYWLIRGSAVILLGVAAGLLPVLLAIGLAMSRK